jgi:hypothetical protein
MRKLVLVFTAVSLSVAAHAGFVIDDFTDGAVSVSTSSTNPFDADSASASVLGGTRYLAQTFDGPTRRSAAAVADGSLNVSTPSGSFTKTALVYGNAVGSALNMSGIPDWNVGAGTDISLGLNDKLQFNFLSNEQNLNMTVVLQHDMANYTFFSKSITGNQLSPFSVIISSNDIVANWGLGASFSKFDTLYVRFDSSVSGDFELGSIEAVPEPGTIAALGMGALAMLRRRKKA